MFKVFVTGLERGSGKTLVIAGLSATMQSLGYSTSVYKPIQLGAKILGGFKRSVDMETIKYFDSNVETNLTYMFTKTHSPFVSSYEDGVKMDLENIYKDFDKYTNFAEFSFIEGSNSITTPITTNYTETDLVLRFQTPVILVVNANHTSLDNLLMGISHIQSKGINLLGIVFNAVNEAAVDLEEKYYTKIFQEFSDVKILGTLPCYQSARLIKPETLISDVLNNFNLEELFDIKIAKLN